MSVFDPFHSDNNAFFYIGDNEDSNVYIAYGFFLKNIIDYYDKILAKFDDNYSILSSESIKGILSIFPNLIFMKIDTIKYNIILL